MYKVNKVFVFSEYVELILGSAIPDLPIILIFQSEIHDMLYAGKNAFKFLGKFWRKIVIQEEHNCC